MGAMDALHERTMRVPVGVMTDEQWRERRVEFLGWVDESLAEDVDYGSVGGMKKATLFQPGADKILLYFGLSAMPTLLEHVADPDSGYLYVVYRADGIDLETGRPAGYGVGAGSSYEAHWRDVTERSYADAPPGDGWTDSGNHWERRSQRDPSDLVSLWNSVHKVVFKRARVALALSVSGLTERFTQDMDDLRDVYGLTGEPVTKRTMMRKAAGRGSNGNGQTEKTTDKTEERRGGMQPAEWGDLARWAEELRQALTPEMRSVSDLYKLAYDTPNPRDIPDPLGAAKPALTRAAARHYAKTKATALSREVDAEEVLAWARKKTEGQDLTAESIRAAIDAWFQQETEPEQPETEQPEPEQPPLPPTKEEQEGSSAALVASIPLWAKATGVEVWDVPGLARSILKMAESEGKGPRQVMEDHFSVLVLRKMTQGVAPELDVYEVLESAKALRDERYNHPLAIDEWLPLLSETLGAALEEQEAAEEVSE